MELRGAAGPARNGYVSNDILEQLRGHVRASTENIMIQYTRKHDGRLKARIVVG